MNSNTDFAAAAAALESVPLSGGRYGAVTDAELLALSRGAARVRQLADAHVAVIAGEIARRSARELGSDGMAQRLGLRTPEELVRVTNRSTSREALAAVRVGRIVVTPDEPWLAPVSSAILDGTLPVASADAIRVGLGAPSAGVGEAALRDAAAQLCSDGAALDPDRLHRRARELRDQLDEAGIADRERARRAQRGLRFTKLPDGMSRAVWVMDPETSAVFGNLYDRATSPRRGGPRFVGDDARTVAEKILADGRTTEQLASDVFLELLRHGADSDSSELLGSGGASITLHVDATALDTGTGHGYIEGQPDPVTIETVQRLACAGSVTEVTFGSAGQPLDLGREERLYSRRQRRALAARDGGCLAPGCDRPPSWTEAHHIKHWARDRGRTDIADGVLLCRHHHLLFHNNGWEIERVKTDYWLVPPTSVDPSQERILLESKNPLRRQRRAA
jgi:hypothetical protein